MTAPPLAPSPVSPPASVRQRPSPAASYDPDQHKINRQHWSASAWMLWRERGSYALLQNNGQLGGAQAGMRIDRHLGTLSDMPIAAYGRISRALHKPTSAETATGITAQVIQGIVPVNIHAERRFRLETGGRNAFALFATSGINPTSVGHNMSVEGYVQAGIVGLRNRDVFFDGRVAITAPITRNDNGNSPALTSNEPRIGVAISGGSQPNVSRLDIGPVLEMRLPSLTVSGGARPRLLLEWRERIAGSARPDSGPVITIASDF